jgi:hypothetical protein
MLTQPAAVAEHGRLFLAINSSTSPRYGEGSGSVIRLLYSPDGGTTWDAPVVVADASSSAPQHVLPAITADPTGSQLRITDYVQNAAGKLSVESQTGTIGPNGVRFGQPTQIASPFDLPPTNITISPNVTASYDVTAPCYAVGEYLGTAQTASGAVAAWGGDRQQWKEPPGAIVSGVHAQQDVFFAQLP